MHSRMWFAGTKARFLDGLAVLPDVWELSLNLILKFCSFSKPEKLCYELNELHKKTLRIN